MNKLTENGVSARELMGFVWLPATVAMSLEGIVPMVLMQILRTAAAPDMRGRKARPSWRPTGLSNIYAPPPRCARSRLFSR